MSFSALKSSPRRTSIFMHVWFAHPFSPLRVRSSSRVRYICCSVLLSLQDFDQAFACVDFDGVSGSDLFDVDLVDHWDVCYYCAYNDYWVCCLIDNGFGG